MWPFSSSTTSKPVEPAVLEQLQRRSKRLRQAYIGCLKSNKHLEPAAADQACKGLEVSLIECYADHPATCQEKAAAFKTCVQEVQLDEELDYSICEGRLADMQKCLKKHRLYPVSVQ